MPDIGPIPAGILLAILFAWLIHYLTHKGQ